MRAYFFGNMYLSSIQQGIQSAHVLAEMYNKYVFPDGCQEYFILENWAKEHKTMVLLNAGYSEEIHSLVSFFDTKDNPLPWAKFHEGKDALDGALTCVGIILPEEFYEGAKELKNLGGPYGAIMDQQGTHFKKLQPGWEQAMAMRLNNYSLAK